MTDVTEAALEPCPFCGSLAVCIAVKRPSFIKCDNCGAQGPQATKPTFAPTAWNRRALLAGHDEVVEQCRQEFAALYEEATARIAALEAEVARLQVDAARWRGLMASARVRVMGSAGMTNGQASAGYMHMGVEFWSEHSAASDPRFPQESSRKQVVAYADEMARRAALEAGNG